MRLGFRAVSIPLPRREPADSALNITMERIPFLLETVRVSSNAACGSSAGNKAAFELWDQARAALLNSIVARESNSAEVTLMTYERELELPDRRVTQHQVRISTGASKRPFVTARPASQLAAQGYRTVVGSDQIYNAPDADVLFDDSFAGGHCFGMQVGGGEHEGQVGLTFVPGSEASRKGIVDVRGTLWLDAKVPALVRLDFKYTGTDPAFERAGAGGTIHFQSMSNGVVFIDEWTISLPILLRITDRKPPNDVVATDLAESGGVVLSSKWGDGAKWTGTIGAIRGRLVERGSNAAVPGAEVSLLGVALTTTDSAGRFSFGLLPAGRYDLEVVDSAFAQFLRPRKDGRDVVIGRGDTANVTFEASARSSLIEGLCKGQPASESVLLGHISDGTRVWPKELRIESEWLASVMATSTSIGVRTDQSLVSVDDNGRFFICGIARGGPAIRLRAVVGKTVLADTTLAGIRDAVPGSARVIDWKLPRGLFAGRRLERNPPR